MLSFPIWNGISGHLIGGVFAAAILGVPAGILSLSLVLLLQTLLFGDGGLLMLGANIVNMALMGAGVGGLLLHHLRKRNGDSARAVFLAATASVVLAVLSLGGELAASGKATLPILATLIGMHTALAVVEGLATCVLLKAAIPSPRPSVSSHRLYFALTSLILGGLLLTPLASEFPDAFEWTMDNAHLLTPAPSFSIAPFAGYLAWGSTLLAGLIDVVATGALAFPLALLLHTRAPVRERI